MPVTDVIGTYETQHPVGFPGMIAESQNIKDVASLVVENGAIAFGLAAGRGVADGSARLGAAVGSYVGIAVADKSRDADQYDVGEVGGFIRKGTVWVTASVAVADGEAVYFVPATGVITNTSATNTNTLIPDAHFETTAAAGALVRVYLG